MGPYVRISGATNHEETTIGQVTEQITHSLSWGDQKKRALALSKLQNLEVERGPMGEFVRLEP
jgi:hypothetical protein